MELIEGLTTRRSIRKFKDEKVDMNTIEKVISVCQYAPSWKNSQSVRYNLVTDTNKIKEIGDSIGMDWNKGILYGAPQLMVITTVNKRSGYERDGNPSTSKGSHWQSFDAGIFSYSFELACHAYGLGAVIMGIFKEDKVKEILNISDLESVSALIPFGYPNESPQAPERKEVKDILRVVE